MRSSTLVSVLFTAGVLATPMIDRRALVFKDFVVTVTKFTTIGVPEASAAAAVVAVQPKAAAVYVPHGHYHKHQSAQSLAQVAASTSSSTTSSTTSSSFTSSSSSPVYVAPSSTQPTSTSTPPPYAAPAAPETTSTPTKAQSANNNLPTTAVPNLDSASDIYKGLSLQHHNVHRQNHSVSDMAWNETLAGYAEEVAKTCKWGHSSVPGGGGYGQNIAAGPEPGKVADVISNMWYNGELELYPTPYGIDSPNMGNFEGWGHFSQVVWSDSESVGCYTSTCFPAGQDPQDCQSDGTSYLSGLTCGNGGVPAYFTVCNYYPAGNFGGEYSKVKAPGSMGIVAMSEEGVVSGL